MMCCGSGVVEINGRVPMCGRVVTSLHVAASDGWVPVRDVLSPVCILQHLAVGYQCVACCDQSAYCRIRRLGTNAWCVVTSLHIATSDSWVPVCGVLWPVCILPHPTVGYQCVGMMWPVYVLLHPVVGYQCVTCCHQSAYCNIWQLGTSM